MNDGVSAFIHCACAHDLAIWWFYINGRSVSSFMRSLLLQDVKKQECKMNLDTHTYIHAYMSVLKKRERRKKN